VKLLAEAEGIPVYQPQKVKSGEAIERIAALAPVCIAVVAYGQLLPAGILALPQLGAVNVHASLLPKYRGPAPINWALIRGEEKTGVTTMLMDMGMDTGGILMQSEVVIEPKDTAGTLQDRLAVEGAELLVETLHLLKKGMVQPRGQDDSQASLAPMLVKEDGEIDWNEEAKKICCRIRGLDPWPGGFTLWKGKRLKLFGCQALSMVTRAKPGTVIAVNEGGLQVASGTGAILIKTLQLEGRRSLPVADFLRGYSLQLETRFGE
jgi:methionyl-tRNA formyltransferase